MRAAALAALAVLACDPLVQDGYFGDPVFEIEGRIVDFGFLEPTDETPTASLMWSVTGETTVEPAELVSQGSVAVGVQFPSTFKLRVFDLPPRANQSRDSAYEVGLIVIWNDDDGDGVYDRSELRGGAFFNVVLYSRAGLPASESPTGLALPIGFTVAELPLDCIEHEPIVGADDCGVPLGSPCERDSDCGALGECLDTDGFISFPGGYCVLPDDAGCVPSGAGYIGLETRTVWARGCSRDADCVRSDDADYECLHWSATCWPRAPVALFVGPDAQFEPLCIDAFQPLP